MMMRRKTIAAVATTFVVATGLAHAQGDPKRGEKIYENCRACHAADGAANEVGPGLRGVFGRRAGVTISATLRRSSAAASTGRPRR